MKKGRLNLKVIIIFVLIIIFIIGIYKYIFNDKKNKKNNNNNYSNIVERVSKNNEFYKVKNSLNKFYFTCKSYNVPEDSSTNLEDTLSKIYEMLDTEYIRKYSVNIDNLKDKIAIFKQDEIQINDMYIIQKKDNISMYLVKVTELIKNNDNEKDYSFIVKLDDENNVFSIYLNDYINDMGYNNLNLDQEINIDVNSIQIKSMNMYDNVVVYITEYQKDLFNDFKKSCMFNKVRAYNLIDYENKQQKFDDFDAFTYYIKENIVKITSMNIEKVDVNNYDGYREFNYITDKGLSFTFKETASMKYTVIIQ